MHRRLHRCADGPTHCTRTATSAASTLSSRGFRLFEQKLSSSRLVVECSTGRLSMCTGRNLVAVNATATKVLFRFERRRTRWGRLPATPVVFPSLIIDLPSIKRFRPACFLFSPPRDNEVARTFTRVLFAQSSCSLRSYCFCRPFVWFYVELTFPGISRYNEYRNVKGLVLHMMLCIHKFEDW